MQSIMAPAKKPAKPSQEALDNAYWEGWDSCVRHLGEQSCKYPPRGEGEGNGNPLRKEWWDGFLSAELDELNQKLEANWESLRNG